MDSLAVLIRKWDKDKNGKFLVPTRKLLQKQILTLHKKLKKCDNEIVTEYSIEKDIDRNSLHIHLIIKFQNKISLYKMLGRFIGGGEWILRYEGVGSFDECSGLYGLIHIENIRDEKKYRSYMNKKDISRVLI